MRNNLRKKLFSLLILWLVSLGSSVGLAQDKGLKKIRWGVTSISAANWIPWIAKEAKIYDKNGLDVELILLRGSGQTSPAIISGSIFAAPVTLATVMLANLGGADLTTVAHTVPGVQSKLLVRQEIKRPEDLKGKKLATSGLGSLGDFLNRYIVKKYGLDPNRDIVWFSVGTPPERLQALVSGSVEAADLSHPSDVQGERLGFRVLWDARQEVSYPSMSVVTRRKHVQEDRDTVMRMVKSHVEAIHYFKTHRDFSLKVLSKHLRTNDREILEGSYEIYRQDFISVPYPITQGLQATYEYVAQRRPEILSHKPDEFMDPSFIAELDKGGFIKRLSGQR